MSSVLTSQRSKESWGEQPPLGLGLGPNEMKIISTAERPINLLQIIGGSIVGGMETYVLRLLQRLPRDSFRVTCLCLAESEITESLRDIGCTVHITPLT